MHNTAGNAPKANSRESGYPCPKSATSPFGLRDVWTKDYSMGMDVDLHRKRPCYPLDVLRTLLNVRKTRNPLGRGTTGSSRMLAFEWGGTLTF